LDYLVSNGRYNYNVYNIDYLCEYGNLCYNLEPIKNFLNNKTVQKAIGVDKKFELCNNTLYMEFYKDFNKP